MTDLERKILEALEQVLLRAEDNRLNPPLASTSVLAARAGARGKFGKPKSAFREAAGRLDSRQLVYRIRGRGRFPDRWGITALGSAALREGNER